MEARKLKKVSSQLKKSVKAHAKQANIIDGYLSSIKDKSPAMKKVKAKGGGTKKVCLPLAKIRSMSSSEKSKIVSAKRKAGAAGKYKRSSKSNTTGCAKRLLISRKFIDCPYRVQKVVAERPAITAMYLKK